VPHFDPEYEADLNHVLDSGGGTPDLGPTQRTNLPPIEDSQQAAKGFS
jgi:hypothetical protein